MNRSLSGIIGMTAVLQARQAFERQLLTVLPLKVKVFDFLAEMRQNNSSKHMHLQIHQLRANKEAIL
ncbi:hypothetical protein [Exiguobacterium sp. RIT452]|uniref:hypothetical protein n=1 Tax=Exiguobacterium sp. RIT452 TaxID=2315552 RepID=UPI0011C218A9|nr:hypothetical protein [Exiguobacterium sp. RIT452]